MVFVLHGAIVKKNLILYFHILYALQFFIILLLLESIFMYLHVYCVIFTEKFPYQLYILYTFSLNFLFLYIVHNYAAQFLSSTSKSYRNDIK